MSKRGVGIIILIAILLLAVGVVYFNSSWHNNPNNEKRSAASLYPIVIAIVLSPVLIAFLSNSSPEQPVNGVIRACRRYERRQKFEAIRPYLSKKFLRSPKVLLLVQWHPEDSKVVYVEVTGERKQMLVRVTLKNDQYYVFTVVRRENYIDPVGTTDWVIDNIEGPGF